MLLIYEAIGEGEVGESAAASFFGFLGVAISLSFASKFKVL